MTGSLPLKRALDRTGDVLAAGFACLAVYTAGFGVFDNIVYSGVIVALGVAIFLIDRRYGGFGEGPDHGVFRRLADVAMIALFAWLTWRWLGIMLEQEEFFIDISRFDNALAWVAFAMIGYLTFLGFGWPMFIVYAISALYIVAPGVIGGAGENWLRVAENLWFSTDGVYGRPVEVVGRIVLVFIVFGAILQTSGAGAVLLRLAFAATSRFAGGPAHASIIGSALFGTLSGAPIANVVSTGVFTIPVIKRAGFKPKFAGGVEAAASTGGQIMPPVMGVVAFLMADVTGIPYLQIVLAATIPALFYYLSLFLVVLIEARKRGIGATPKHLRQGLEPGDWLRSSAFFLPLVIIVAVLVTGRTAQMAGFWALIAAAILSLAFFPDFRNPARWWEALVAAGKTAALLMVIVASIGFIIGVINMTGVGLKFAQAILAVSGESLFLSLLLVMLGCLVMGMGVPSGPAYLIVALVMGPALSRLGLPTISAHLFMLYFGVLSVVTPPVALAAFAAAPIAGAKPMETGFEAVRLSLAGFIIPFVFVYHPDILIIEGATAGGLLWSVACFLVATWLIATAIAGFDLRTVPYWERALRLVCAILILVPDVASSAIAGVAGIALCAFHRLTTRRLPQTETSEGSEA